METIISEFLNGAISDCDTYIDYRNECTRSITQLRAEVDGDVVKFICSVLCRDTHDWDKHPYWKDFELGECGIGDTVIGEINLIDGDGRYLIKLGLDNVQRSIEIQCKEEFFTWTCNVGKYSRGLYDKTPFTNLTMKFVDRPADFFKQVDTFTFKASNAVTPEQYEMLTRILPPLQKPSLQKSVKEILLETVIDGDYFEEARAKDSDNWAQIQSSAKQYQLLKKRIEWLNGYYVNRRPDDPTEPTDVLMPTFGWSAMGTERRIVDKMMTHGKQLGLKRIAEMNRIPENKARKIWVRFKKLNKVLSEISPFFYTNERMFWNP